MIFQQGQQGQWNFNSCWKSIVTTTPNCPCNRNMEEYTLRHGRKTTSTDLRTGTTRTTRTKKPIFFILKYIFKKNKASKKCPSSPPPCKSNLLVEIYENVSYVSYVCRNYQFLLEIAKSPISILKC